MRTTPTEDTYGYLNQAYEFESVRSNLKHKLMAA